MKYRSWYKPVRLSKEEQRELLSSVEYDARVESKEQAEFKAAHPDGCSHCLGRGVLHDRYGVESDCPECLELGKCPQCGEPLAQELTTGFFFRCPECHWQVS